VSFGQNGLLSLALLTGAWLLWRRNRAMAAGALSGLLLYKPHLLLGLLLFYLAEGPRGRRALLGLFLTGAALATLSGLLLPEATRAYLDLAQSVYPDLPGWKEFPLWHLHSPRGFWRLLLPGQPRLADALTLLSALMAAGAAFRFWRRHREDPLRFAAAVVLTVYLTPHAMIYDWSILLLPALLLWEHAPAARPAPARGLRPGLGRLLPRSAPHRLDGPPHWLGDTMDAAGPHRGRRRGEAFASRRGGRMNNLRVSMRMDGLLKLLLVAAGLAILVGATASLFDAPALRRDDDFGILWGSAYLHRTGGNPYSLGDLNRILKDIGHEPIPQEAVALMWYAPYAFAALFPFALLPYPIARALWFWLSLIALAVSFAWIWRRYAGPSSRIWIAWVLGFFFFPTLTMWLKGQIGWLILLGLIGLVISLERNSPIGAGLALLPLLLKPHLVYLVLLVYLLWAWRQRFGGSRGDLRAGIGDRHRHCMDPESPCSSALSPGHALSRASGVGNPDHRLHVAAAAGPGSRLAELPPHDPGHGLGGLALARPASALELDGRDAPLIIASILTSPYGWSFDWVLMMWPLLQVAAAIAQASKPALTIGGYAASMIGINLLGFFTYLFAYPYFWGDVSQIWMPWIISIKYLMFRRFR
jgi:hypothetical protein